MKIAMLISGLFIFPLAVSAAQINDAFGITLGQKINTSQMRPNSAFDTQPEVSGPATYSFSPSSNDLQIPFDEYSFSTDQSRQYITSIMASKNTASAQQCISLLSSITNNAARKYGQPNYAKNGFANFTDDSNKGRTLAISCSQNVLTFVVNNISPNLKF